MTAGGAFPCEYTGARRSKGTGRAALLWALCLTAVVPAGCEDPVTRPETEIGTTEVWIDDYHFSPLHKYVVPGAEVTWINKDAVPHTVVSGTPDDPGRWFESDSIEPGETFGLTFDEKNTYRYHCSLHTDRLKLLNDMPVLIVTPLVQPVPG